MTSFPVTKIWFKRKARLGRQFNENVKTAK
jgi:hypothetical protein